MMAGATKAQELNRALRVALASKDLTELARLLKSVREDRQWVLAFSEAVTLKETIVSIGTTFPSKEALTSLAEELSKTVASIILPFEKVAQEWWTEPAQSPSSSVTLSFQDATATYLPSRVHDTWDTTLIESNLAEDFRTAFLRFRSRGNKKYRHPLLPSLDFDIVVLPKGRQSESETALISSEDAGKHTIQSIQDLLELDTTTDRLIVPYVRSDHRNPESKKTPAQSIRPWLRLLPDWFINTPSSWILPIPPPAFSAGPLNNPEPTAAIYQLTSYYQIPLLKYVGTGRNILPNITSPSHIASHIYVPVNTHISPYGVKVYVAMELANDRAQLVRNEDRISLPLTHEQAQSLLGRVVQYSIEPLPAPNEPRKKKKARRSILTEFVTAVWGYDTSTRMLHCVDPSDFLPTSFVMDVSKTGSHTFSSPSLTDAYGVPTKHAYWIGLVSLPEDELARTRERQQDANKASAAQEPTTSTAAQSAPDLQLAFKTLISLVEEMNLSNDARAFQVTKQSDILMLGDMQLAKTGLDFELTVTPLKTGKWHVTEVSETEVLLTCGAAAAAEGSQSAGDGAISAHEWEALGSFSIDAGIAGAFLASAFDAGGALYGYGAEEDAESMLEILMDHVMDGDQRVLAVPGGVLFSANDGGYEVEGRRDGAGELVAIRVR